MWLMLAADSLFGLLCITVPLFFLLTALSDTEQQGLDLFTPDVSFNRQSIIAAPQWIYLVMRFTSPKVIGHWPVNNQVLCPVQTCECTV